MSRLARGEWTGKWVEVKYQGERVVGFVMDESFASCEIKPTSENAVGKVLFLEKNEINLLEDSTPDVEAIKILIDLALDQEQEEWFYELCEKLEEWKKMEEVKEII